MAEVREKCVRCKMRASEDDGGHCKLCDEELMQMAVVNIYGPFDHYFWGLTASRDEQFYYIRIYHNCDDLDWLKGKSVKIDLDDAEDAVCGVVTVAESMQKPPYERGDVVTVTLAPLERQV
jgi:hypothetical protein